MGRQSIRTAEIDDQVIRQLTEGVPLEVICLPPHMPAPRTVQDWEAKDPEFAASIARAREAGEYALAWECKEIADDGSRDYQVTEDGRAVPDHDHIQRSKLRIETRLKLLAKFNPKRWGDRIEHTGKVTLESLIAAANTAPASE